MKEPGHGRRQSAPPLRLRMVSSDFLCGRSMEVEWEDGRGVQQRWSSWEESGAWYEAEKLLPSCATDICVRFRAHLAGTAATRVRGVNRRDGCEWLPEDPFTGKVPVEEVWLRSGPQEREAGVDVIFAMKGPIKGCYMRRAWNIAREGEPEWWEHWEDEETRPSRDQSPLATLEAADGAAPLGAALGEPKLHLICSKKRMCAAARELIQVHRATLEGLRDIDVRFTGQWFSANAGNTASAGLGIASAVLLFTAPPVGIALGVGSAVAGGLTFAGDMLADYANGSSLRNQLSRDAWNAFALAELVDEFRRATEAVGASGAGAWASSDGSPSGASSSSDREGTSDAAGRAADGTLAVSAVANGTASTATRVISSAADLGAKAAAAGQAFGIVGAVVQTGVALRGWSSTKSGQQQVRSKITELTSHVLQLQRLLAALDWIECAVCGDGMSLAEEVRLCQGHAHCFHARCLDRIGRGGEGADCPCCPSKLRREEVMVDALDAFERELRPPPPAEGGGSSGSAARMIARLGSGRVAAASRAWALSAARRVQADRAPLMALENRV